jgi:hypothetical protein
MLATEPYLNTLLNVLPGAAWPKHPLHRRGPTVLKALLMKNLCTAVVSYRTGTTTLASRSRAS